MTQDPPKGTKHHREQSEENLIEKIGLEGLNNFKTWIFRVQNSKKKCNFWLKEGNFDPLYAIETQIWCFLIELDLWEAKNINLHI